MGLRPLLVIFGVSSTEATRIIRANKWVEPTLVKEMVDKITNSLAHSVNIILSVVVSYEIEVAKIELERASPFTRCMPYFAETKEALLEWQLETQTRPVTPENPFGLTPIGEVAEGGEFFALRDPRFLVKKSSQAEAESLAMLAQTGAVSKVYDSCQGFATTLLSPALLSFQAENDFYILMRNRTAVLSKHKDWILSSLYKVKPLPDKSRGLYNFLELLFPGGNEELPVLSLWPQWTLLTLLIERDLELLEGLQSTDFSLSIHFLTRESPVQNLDVVGMPLGEEGCIRSPNGNALLCFDIVDYLGPFRIGHQAEDLVQGGMFDRYPTRMRTALHCFGNLVWPLCCFYRDYLRIGNYTDGRLDARFNGLLVGTHSFLNSYRCTSHVTFLSALMTRLNVVGGPTELLYEIARDKFEFVDRSEDLELFSHLSPACREVVLAEASETKEGHQNIILLHAADSILVVGPSPGWFSPRVDTSLCKLPLGRFTCTLQIPDPFQFGYSHPLERELSMLVVHAPSLFAF